MKKILIAVTALFLSAAAYGQTVRGGQYAQQAALLTVGVNSWVVPPNVTLIFVDGCAPGGAGGGGQASAATAGGGGGGAGACARNLALPVTSGSTLTVTIPATPTGPAAGSSGR